MITLESFFAHKAIAHPEVIGIGHDLCSPQEAQRMATELRAHPKAVMTVVRVEGRWVHWRWGAEQPAEFKPEADLVLS